MKTLSYAMSLTAALVLTTAVNVRAGESASPMLGVLSGVTALELPAKSAELVKQADAKTMKQTTIDVVKAAVGLNPAAAALIVGAIAQSSPEMAGTAAATAVGLLPDQAVSIARAAAAAAPGQAGKIVEAICRVLPTAYQKVADAVAEVVPGASKEILAGIAAAIPSLKGSINTALAGYTGMTPSVSTVLEQATQSRNSDVTVSLASANPMDLPRGPSVGAPIITPSQTPTNNLNAGSGGEVPTGGHNYAPP